MARWGLALVALAGCDVVFNADRLYECPDDDDDCDQLLDRVDPCPADAGDAADVDGDGVGDECDPQLYVATDRLLEFEGFADLDARWAPRGEASWELSDSALVVYDGAIERTVPLNSQPTVEVWLSPEFAGENATAGVLVASKTSTGIPLECRVEHHEAGDDLVMLIGDPAMGTPVEIGRAKGLPAAPNGALRIYGGQLPNFIVRCRARYGDNDALYVDWEGWMMPVDFDTIGFRVQNATAEYRALAIYTTQP